VSSGKGSGAETKEEDESEGAFVAAGSAQMGGGACACWQKISNRTAWEQLYKQLGLGVPGGWGVGLVSGLVVLVA
jgi:hypothetical protein